MRKGAPIGSPFFYLGGKALSTSESTEDDQFQAGTVSHSEKKLI